MIRLKRSDWEHLAPDSPGRLRASHDSELCQGDSQSLLIEHKDDGSLSAYCFRCGAKGFIPSPGYYRAPKEQGSGHQVELTEHEGYLLPEDASKDVQSFPMEVRTWLGKAGLQDSERGFLWSPAKETLYWPVEQEGRSLYGPKLVGFVLRRFSPKRYLTLTKDPESFWGLYRASQGHVEGGGTLVLTEDVLSAWRVAELADSLALMGTELKSQALAFLVRAGYNRAIVFLDGDNPTVRMKARKIAQDLSFMPQVEVVETGKDPKLYSKDSLRELLQLQA